MTSFWDGLKRPFFALAPLADVTDPALRRLVAQIHKPDVTWTEFVSADGLYATREVKKMKDEENPLMRDLQFSSGEHPIVAQIFGSNTDTIAYAAQLAEKLGFDGVDINMGCPDKAIEKQGAGAAMIKTPEKAQEVIRAAQGATSLPVTVKTRIGYNTEVLDTWIPALLEMNLPALTVHLRTRKEMSLVPARWELMPKIVALRNKYAPNTLAIGNGDVKDLEEAERKIRETGCDGVMMGRAIFGNPWLFAGRKLEDTSPKERIDALVALAHAFDELRPKKSFHILKKHIKAFVAGFDGAAEVRAKLMETESAEELASVVAAHPLYWAT